MRGRSDISTTSISRHQTRSSGWMTSEIDTELIIIPNCFTPHLAAEASTRAHKGPDLLPYPPTAFPLSFLAGAGEVHDRKEINEAEICTRMELDGLPGEERIPPYYLWTRESTRWIVGAQEFKEKKRASHLPGMFSICCTHLQKGMVGLGWNGAKSSRTGKTVLAQIALLSFLSLDFPGAVTRQPSGP